MPTFTPRPPRLLRNAALAVASIAATAVAVTALLIGPGDDTSAEACVDGQTWVVARPVFSPLPAYSSDEQTKPTPTTLDQFAWAELAGCVDAKQLQPLPPTDARG